MTPRSRSDPAPRRATRATVPRVSGARVEMRPETRAEIADAPLLTLARAIAELRATDAVAPLDAALERLAHAYGDDGTATAALFDAWLRRHRDGQQEKARELALAWAREQVRLALQELLEQEVARGRVRTDVGVEGLAWMLLAGCEALAHEPAGAAAERIRLLLALAAAR